MRPLRARRPVDDHTASLARARVAQLTGAGRFDAASPEDGARLDGVGFDGVGLGGDGVRLDGDGLGRVGFGDGDGVAPGDDERGGGERGGGERETAPEWLDALQDRMPLGVRPGRFGRLGLERGHVAVIVLVVLLGVIGAVVLFLLARPEVVPIEPEVTSTGTPVATGTEPAGAAAPDPPPSAGGDHSAHGDGGDAGAGPIVIHVAGLVARPGVVELPAGSRVVDAIEAAGGATAAADLTPINLARVLTDGEQVLVTAAPPAQPASPSGQPGAGTNPGTNGGTGEDGAPAGPVNLNTATAAELETLPGIGPTLAGRILEWRAQNGRFSTVDELREVSGIGEQRFAQLEPLVTL